MCLSTVDEKVTKTKGIGYKLVNRGLMTHKGWGGQRQVLLIKGEWVHDTKPLKELIRELCTFSSPRYKPGFHIFLTRKDAKRWAERMGWNSCTIVKVRFYSVVAQGSDQGKEVVVARYIKVL